MRSLIALALLLPATAAGQDLADRVREVPDGTVRLSYAAREGICGNGGQGWSRYDQDDHHDWIAVCDRGPVMVQLRTTRGRITDLDVWVGGRWSDRPATLDLGRVAAPVAAEFLLGLRVQGAVAAASIADSIQVWPRLLELARDDDVPEHIRRDAIFWISQAAGDSATRGLTELTNDDEREIREAAVFALSQLRGSSSVEALLRLARTHRDPHVRRTAIFWLGQSRDPRALAYFEEVLRQ